MTDTTDRKNVAETTMEIMETYGQHTDIIPLEDFDFSTSELITLPHGRKVEDLTHLRRAALEYIKPARRRGTARLEDLQSLIDWANRFKGPSSALFAKPDLEAPTLTCIADYHAEGPADQITPTGDATARHCSHRAIYNFPLSEEWKTWTGVSGKPLQKDDLGEFIEANAKDIMDPTPAILAGKESDDNQNWENRLIQTAQQIEGRYGQLNNLLAMSREFEVRETSDLKIVTNRDTGEKEIQFLNEHKGADGKPLKTPNLIIITIPVFQGEAPYRMPVRLRYRKSGGDLRFTLSIYNPEKAFEAAFNEAIAMAKANIELPLFMGTPEA